MAAHGVIRATYDLDLLVEPTQENGERVIEALTAFFGSRPTNLSAAEFTDPQKVIWFGHSDRRIDLINEISGVSFEEAWQDRVTTRIDDIALHVLGIKSLARNKKASGRTKDLADLELIEKKYPGISSQPG